ncbi:Glucosamine-6-phosphate deaminase [Labeo rohita]|uniref:Glucosamine-6-phosphate deaminase n=1 Tax=Labeo rohita TaxID=84645 RepID=A0ABQ8LAC1_LABRO|nr:Glucosamine-6-phosphate deaminase [Labeo rohita]
MFTAEQETHIVNMVIANNSITLCEIQQRIIEDDTTFQNIHNVSISVLGRVLARNRIRMKQIYRVPFERFISFNNDCYIGVWSDQSYSSYWDDR